MGFIGVKLFSLGDMINFDIVFYLLEVNSSENEGFSSWWITDISLAILALL